MLAKLIQAGVKPSVARVFEPHLIGAFDHFDIFGARRESAFLAQACIESNYLTDLEEDLFYRSIDRIRLVYKRLSERPNSELGPLVGQPLRLANAAYANVNGNGDEDSGDGWLYRGRGIFQLTGRANYMAAGDALQQPYKQSPELVSEPRDAVWTACWFWSANGCNELADGERISQITRRINGPALMHANERQAAYNLNTGIFA